MRSVFKSLKAICRLACLLAPLMLTSCDQEGGGLLAGLSNSAKSLFRRGDISGGVNQIVTPPGYDSCPQAPELMAFAATRSPHNPALDAIERIAEPEETIEPRATPDEAPPLRRSRGLLEFPTAVESDSVGACQSHHYNPDGDRVDQYIAPHTGCAFASVLQDWNQICPGYDSGCRLAWGDVSHRDEPVFNGHQSHSGGECVDIRPMRTSGQGALTYRDTGVYDPEKTQQLIDLLRAKGGTGILFNDSNIDGASPWPNHDNHIHVCFRNTNQTNRTCEQLEPDYNRCPMLYNFLESPEVRSIRE